MKNPMIKKAIVTCILAIAAISGIASHAGRLGGPGDSFLRIERESVEDLFVVFAGGRMAEVGLEGDGDTDVDIFIYDEYDNLVASAESWDDIEIVSFWVSTTALYRVRVVNLGRVYNDCYLWTN